MPYRYRTRRIKQSEYAVSVLVLILLVALYLVGRSRYGTDTTVATEADSTTAPTAATTIEPLIAPGKKVATEEPTSPFSTTGATEKPPVRQVSAHKSLPSTELKQTPVRTPSAVPAKPPAASTRTIFIDGHAVTQVFEPTFQGVRDGDSIQVTDGDSPPFDLRLASIDAPELQQPYGRVSRQHLEHLIAGKQAVAYQVDTDRYQRKVVFLFVKDRQSSDPYVEVNAAMVADGYAWHAVRYSQNEKLAKLQSNARAARLGLWEQSRPQAPWNYRDSRGQ